MSSPAATVSTRSSRSSKPTAAPKSAKVPKPRTPAATSRQKPAATQPKPRAGRVPVPAAVVPAPSSARPARTAKTAPLRTSQRLRALLADHPEKDVFTVEEIVRSLGDESFGTSLMFFAIPEVLPIPIPAISALVVLPTAAISAQMIRGRKQIKLPGYILKRSVPRKALAGAIYAILPVLERAEKRSKRRLEWATDAKAQRLLGLFIFLLSMAIAVPIPGFNMPQAIAIFVIGLGLVEKDGLIVAAGVVIGLLSLLLLGGVLFGLFSFFGISGW